MGIQISVNLIDTAAEVARAVDPLALDSGDLLQILPGRAELSDDSGATTLLLEVATLEFISGLAHCWEILATGSRHHEVSELDGEYVIKFARSVSTVALTVQHSSDTVRFSTSMAQLHSVLEPTVQEAFHDAERAWPRLLQNPDYVQLRARINQALLIKPYWE